MESWTIFFPTYSAEDNPDDADISFVSFGLLNSSCANPGVSVSGGKANVNLTLVPTSSMNMASARPLTAHLPALYAL